MTWRCLSWIVDFLMFFLDLKSLLLNFEEIFKFNLIKSIAMKKVFMSMAIVAAMMAAVACGNNSSKKTDEKAAEATEQCCQDKECTKAEGECCGECTEGECCKAEGECCKAEGECCKAEGECAEACPDCEAATSEEAAE